MSDIANLNPDEYGHFFGGLDSFFGSHDQHLFAHATGHARTHAQNIKKMQKMGGGTVTTSLFFYCVVFSFITYDNNRNFRMQN